MSYTKQTWATGDLVTAEKLNHIEDGLETASGITSAEMAIAVNDWLDDHPEATTTVEDGSITNAKLATSFASPGVAAAFSSSTAYAAGDYVFYGGALYRFTAAHAAGAWSGSDAVAVKLAEDVVEVKGDFDSLKIQALGIKNGFDAETLAAIGTGTVTKELTLGTDYALYDFKGATVGKINVDCVGATIKNFSTDTTLTFKTGSRNCTIENAKFTNAVQSVEFEANTWAHKFVGCTFLGNGTTVCMNAAAQTNDTLLMTNCYFYKMQAIISAQSSLCINIMGGWCDDCTYIIYGAAACSGNVSITGFDAEEVTAVFKFSAYCNVSLTFGGEVANTSGCICDFTSGVVNLLLTMFMHPSVPLFGTNSPATRFVNFHPLTEMQYPLRDTATEQTVTLYIPPESVVEPFGKKIHLYSANCDNANISFLVNGGSYTKGSTYNGVVNLKVANAANYTVTATLVIKSMNVLA